MSPPAPTSAYLAQQLALRSAAANSSTFSGSSMMRGAGAKGGFEDVLSSDESEGDDEDEGPLIEERFLDPDSAEGIRIKVSGLSAHLSGPARALLPSCRRVLRDATAFREHLEDDVLTLETLKSDLIISVKRHPLSDHDERVLHAEGSLRRFQHTLAHPHSPLEADIDPSPVPNRHPHPPSPLLPPDDDDSSSPLPSSHPTVDFHLDAHFIRPPFDSLSVSSAVFHPHTLPLSAPPPPSVRREHRQARSGSTSPPLLSPAFTPRPSSPISAPTRSDDAATQEELVQLYHFTAAGQHRDSTALGRLLDSVAATGREGRRAEVPPPVRVSSRAVEGEEGAELVFEVVQEEEVEEEEEEVPSRRREVVGR